MDISGIYLDDFSKAALTPPVFGYFPPGTGGYRVASAVRSAALKISTKLLIALVPTMESLILGRFRPCPAGVIEENCKNKIARKKLIAFF